MIETVGIAAKATARAVAKFQGSTGHRVRPLRVWIHLCGHAVNSYKLNLSIVYICVYRGVSPAKSTNMIQLRLVQMMGLQIKFEEQVILMVQANFKRQKHTPSNYGAQHASCTGGEISAIEHETS